MAKNTRTLGKLGSPGPYLAEVSNLLDTTYMGSIEVALIRDIPNSPFKRGSTFQVSYLSPFYGVTSTRFQGNDPKSFNDVQKSYGMWMIPPDIGTTVMVIFVDGNTQDGFWIGCVPDLYQNHMVPGIAASRKTNLTPEQFRLYGTDYLPVAEFLTNPTSADLINKQGTTFSNPDKEKKPVHPFANVLLAQGLLMDTVRGPTSSSARREVPSSVFGISTPGPLDTSPGAPRKLIGYQDEQQKLAPISRLGGSTFVMDDGDITGQNELVRIRTRTGHQILLHNSSDLIYIANASGTAWIELTGAGKIDIYSKDSISVRSENDFNFRADRDVNIEAGRNINMRSVGDTNLNVNGNHSLIVDQNCNILIRQDKDEVVLKNLKVVAREDMHLTALINMNLFSVAEMRQGSGEGFSVSAGGEYRETASVIHMNGPEATPPDAITPVFPTPLAVFELPNTSKEAGWTDKKYKTDNLSSIMKRAPTFEPWDQHDQTLSVTGSDGKIVRQSSFPPDATDVTK